MVAAATEAGVFAMEAMWTRFLPAVEAAREVVAWGRIGQVLGVQGDLCAYRPYNPASRLWDPATGWRGHPGPRGLHRLHGRGVPRGARQVPLRRRYAPNGVESAATMSIGYAGGGTAALTCGFDVHGPAQMAVYGTKGWVEIQPRFHHPTTISVHRSGVLPRIIEAKQVGKGYAHELMEVSDCLLAGRTQSATMPLSDTVEVMRVLDTCLGNSAGHSRRPRSRSDRLLCLGACVLSIPGRLSMAGYLRSDRSLSPS